MASYEESLQDLNIALEQLDLEPMDTLSKSQQGIQHSMHTLKILRAHVVSEGFEDQAAEIHFFKEVKPQVLSKLLYYRKLYVLDSRRPRSSIKTQRRYWEAQITTLQAYFNTHQTLYQYYRSGSSYLDAHYFLRNQADTCGPMEALYIATDWLFSTSHDHLIATFIAYNQLILHIKKQLMMLERPSKDQSINPKRYQSQLRWTGSKRDLVELIYALHASGVLNRGTAPINEIADTFETLLETDLGDYYHTYCELRGRKTRRTKFMELLKTALDTHMDELDR